MQAEVGAATLSWLFISLMRCFQWVGGWQEHGGGGGQLEAPSVWQEQEVVSTASPSWLKMFLSPNTFSSSRPLYLASPLLAMFSTWAWRRWACDMSRRAPAWPLWRHDGTKRWQDGQRCQKRWRGTQNCDNRRWRLWEDITFDGLCERWFSRGKKSSAKD